MIYIVNTTLLKTDEFLQEEMKLMGELNLMKYDWER